MALQIHRFSIKRLVVRRPKKNPVLDTYKLPKPASGKDVIELLHSLPPLSEEDLRDLDRIVREQRQL